MNIKKKQSLSSVGPEIIDHIKRFETINNLENTNIVLDVEDF